jgi:hypothetical protein
MNAKPQITRTFAVRCAVCETHTRPLHVPWQQHAIGCAVRIEELRRRRPELRPTVAGGAGIAAF